MMFIKWLFGSTGMYTNSGKTPFILLTDLIGLECITDIAGSNQQILAAVLPSPVNNFLTIIMMGVFIIVLATELVVGQVGCDVVEFIRAFKYYRSILRVGLWLHSGFQGR